MEILKDMLYTLRTFLEEFYPNNVYMYKNKDNNKDINVKSKKKFK